MTSATKILGVGLLAVVAGCGGATDCELPSDTQCPGGFKQIKGAQAEGKRSLTGGEVVGSEDCSFVCCGDGTSIQGDDCIAISAEGAEGSEENEGSAEGPEGEVEGPEGKPEGPEGTPSEGAEGSEGVEGAEGSEGAEGTPPDAGVEPPDAGLPDAGVEPPDAGVADAGVDGGVCEPDCAGKTCGDDGCGGQCGSCDTLPPPVCVDEKTSLTYPAQDVPGTCGADGKCKWDTKQIPCTGFDTCMEGVCDCIPLTTKEACEGDKKDCGTIANKCGGAVECGQCTAPNTCGGGGTDNVCGCPVCTAPETCGGGGKPGECGAPGGTVYWAQRFRGAGGDLGHSVAVDGSGNIVVTGWFVGTVDFGGGPLTSAGDYDDIFLAKFDASGNHVWSRRFGETSNDQGYSVAVDAQGNVLVTGGFSDTVDFGGGPLTSAGSSDIFVAKYDSSGNHVWSKRFGGTSGDYGMAVAVDSQENVLVTGGFSDTVDFGGGPLTSEGGEDIFVAKYDASGNHIWSKRFGGSGSDWGISTAVDKEGNVAFTGWFQQTVDFGDGSRTSAGSDDIVAAKFDADGVLQWSRVAGGTGQDRGVRIDFDPEGNVGVVGSFYETFAFVGGPTLTSAGSSDIFVAKLDASDGSHLWSKSWGSSGQDQGTSIVINSQGLVLTTGSFQDSIDFGGGTLTSPGVYTGFVAEFDADGNHTWSKPFGGSGNVLSEARGLATDGPGNVVATGFFNGTVDFGGTPLTSAGDADVFLVKLAK